MSDDRKISAVYCWRNGMVMVFDQHGDQMTEYQGRREVVLPKIKAVYSGKIEGEDEPGDYVVPRPMGTPLRELSGRPGEPGYEEFKRIAKSWGHD